MIDVTLPIDDEPLFRSLSITIPPLARPCVSVVPPCLSPITMKRLWDYVKSPPLALVL